MRRARILCVDDELSGLTGRECLLKQHGYEVVISTSAADSLALFQSTSVDAVVLDYRMPGMTGDQLAARMKKLKPDIPIMLLSGYDRLPHAALRWTDTFVSKSAPPAEFVHAVSELIETHSSFFHHWLHNWKRRLSA